MSETYRETLSLAEDGLRRAMAQITAELRAYPTPVSGCDAQYNHLLSERTRISAAIDMLAQPVFVATPRTLEPEAGVESR